MTLNLLLGPRPGEHEPVILADPAARTLEPTLAGVMGQLGDVQRVIFPLPDNLTRRQESPPSLTRDRHAALWHALSDEERTRVLFAAGPTAMYLAPAVEPEAHVLVAVSDPRCFSSESSSAWRAVLGPFPELDEIPEDSGSKQERDQWLDRVRTAVSRYELVRVGEVEDVTLRVAEAVGLGAKQAARAAAVAASAIGDAYGGPRNDPGHWLDQALYSLSPPPAQRPARKRRRR